MAYMKRILLCMMCIGVMTSLVACTESSNMNSATDGSEEEQNTEVVPDDGVLDDAGDMLDDVIDDAESLVDDVKDDIDSEIDDTVDDLEK